MFPEKEKQGRTTLLLLFFVAEVLKQIPEDILNQVIAFEIIGQPETADDLNKEQEALNAGYHVATTRLYGKK